MFVLDKRVDKAVSSCYQENNCSTPAPCSLAVVSPRRRWPCAHQHNGQVPTGADEHRRATQVAVTPAASRATYTCAGRVIPSARVLDTGNERFHTGTDVRGQRGGDQ